MAAAPRTAASPRVLIGNINPGSLSSATAKGLLDAQAAGHRILIYESAPYLDRGRNIVVAAAMDQRDTLGWDWLLFIDSDIEFNANHIATLLAPTTHRSYDPIANPVLCGVYYNTFADHVPGDDPQAQAWVGPVVYEWIKRNFPEDPPDTLPRFAFQRLSTRALSKLPPAHGAWNPHAPAHSLTTRVVAEVGAVGTGFMAIHHSVLVELANSHDQPTAWFVEPVVNKVQLGEDFGFCHRVRSLGYPVLVNRACVVLHHKTMRLP